MIPYRDDNELPRCWCRPWPETVQQRWLFTESSDEVLAALKVSRDDLKRWQANGWISFEIDQMAKLEPPDRWEIEFVRNLARSGLCDCQIARLVESLPKPFRFRPETIAYHFDLGWVCANEVEPDEVIDEHLDEWLSSLAENRGERRLRDLRDRITELLEEIGGTEQVEDD